MRSPQAFRLNRLPLGRCRFRADQPASLARLAEGDQAKTPIFDRNFGDSQSFLIWALPLEILMDICINPTMKKAMRFLDHSKIYSRTWHGL